MSDGLSRAVCALAALLLLVGLAPAQDDRAREVVKKIREDLDRIVEDLAELSAPEAGAQERVAKNMEELIDGMRASQDDVVSSFEELIRSIKPKPSNNPSSGGSGNPSSGSSSGQPPRDGRSSKPRDRNQESGSERKEGQQPEGAGQERNAGGEDKNEEHSQSEGGRRPDDPRGERIPPQIDAEGWGYLPPEVRQLLIERNFRDYFPDYESEIDAYLDSLNRRR